MAKGKLIKGSDVKGMTIDAAAQRAYQLQNIEISSLTGENTKGSGEALPISTESV